MQHLVANKYRKNTWIQKKNKIKEFQRSKTSVLVRNLLELKWKSFLMEQVKWYNTSMQ